MYSFQYITIKSLNVNTSSCTCLSAIQSYRLLTYTNMYVQASIKNALTLPPHTYAHTKENYARYEVRAECENLHPNYKCLCLSCFYIWALKFKDIALKSDNIHRFTDYVYHTKYEFSAIFAALFIRDLSCPDLIRTCDKLVKYRVFYKNRQCSFCMNYGTLEL